MNMPLANPVTVSKVKSGVYAATVAGREPLVIRRDFYKGGWFIWTNGIGLRFSDERFASKSDAVKFLREHWA